MNTHPCRGGHLEASLGVLHLSILISSIAVVCLDLANVGYGWGGHTCNLGCGTHQFSSLLSCCRLSGPSCNAPNQLESGHYCEAKSLYAPGTAWDALQHDGESQKRLPNTLQMAELPLIKAHCICKAYCLLRMFLRLKLG